MPTTTWILVADGARARVLKSEGRGAKLEPALDEEMVGMALGHQTRDLVSDQPGEGKDRAGFGQRRMDPPTEPQRYAKMSFARDVARMLTDRLNHGEFDRLVPDTAAWRAHLDEMKAEHPLRFEQPETGVLKPQTAIRAIHQHWGDDAVYVAGVGQHQMWAAHYLAFERPGSWLNSGGLGTMGYAVPAALGARAGCPDATVWAIDGDGCFQMTNQELATAALNDIPIKVAIINNGALGMVRQWQTLFYDQRYSNTVLRDGPGANGAATSKGTRIPDFVRLSEAMGCVGLRCERPDQLDAVIEKANSINDRPVVVDFIVHEDAMVWPMVAAGTSNDEVMAARGVRPDFGDMGD
jgi:acetolactate synthase I/II/III large subunit